MTHTSSLTISFCVPHTISADLRRLWVPCGFCDHPMMILLFFWDVLPWHLQCQLLYHHWNIRLGKRYTNKVLFMSSFWNAHHMPTEMQNTVQTCITRWLPFILYQHLFFRSICLGDFVILNTNFQLLLWWVEISHPLSPLPHLASPF